MHRIETRQALQEWRDQLGDHAIAFVPTMGNLHAGHLSLIQCAHRHGQAVVVSIFVNPLQFGPTEDYERYPRTLEHDLAACEAANVSAVFCPTADWLTPDIHNTTHVKPPKQLTQQFCGLARPGHFEGMATIVLKLFHLIRPDIAIFGEKDAQQLAIIRQLVSDLNLNITIIEAPVIREADGLAMSSRNQYLSPSLKSQARLLSRLLASAQSAYSQGNTQANTVLKEALESVLDAELYPDFELEYFEAVDQNSFQPCAMLSDNSRLILAARLGQTRLLDTAMIGDPLFLHPDLAQLEI
jgi:pantoate--beta-alanine ligase